MNYRLSAVPVRVKLATLIAAPLAVAGVVVAAAQPAVASINLGGGARSYVLTTASEFYGDVPWAGIRNGAEMIAHCNNNGDAILGGSVTVSRKSSHGTAKLDSVTAQAHGAYEGDDGLVWGTFVTLNGKPAWNTVTVAITCYTTAPKPAPSR